MYCIKLGVVGAVKGIPDHGDHPGEGELGLVGGFGEGEPREEGADEEADVRGEAEIGLVNGAHGGGGAAGKEGADPVAGFRTDGLGAEGMDVVGDGAAAEAGGGELEGALEIPRIPAGVEGDLVPGGVLGGDLGTAVDLHVEAGGAEKGGGAVDPVIAHAIGVVFFFDGTEVEEGPAGQLGFFHLDGILDHPADDAGGRAVEAADEDEVVGKKGGEGADAFVGEVGVGDEAVGGQALDGEKSQFGIDGGGVGAQLHHEILGGEDGGVLGNLERHAAH